MSRLGPHVIRPTPAALEWAARASIVKAIDTIEPFLVAQPGALRVFRHFFPNQDLNANPRDVANALLAALKGYRHLNLLVEVYNEIGKGGRDQYIRLLRGVVPILNAAGVDVAAPSWSTGDWEEADWLAFRAAGWCGICAVSLHCYWGDQGFTPWFALRYRQWWRRGDPRVVITECGRDICPPEGDKRGWKAYGISAEQYRQELARYDLELQRDAYVLGATPFTSGPTPDWSDFTLDEIDTSAFTIAASVVPAPIPPTNNTGRQTMSLREQYPADFAAWEKAGGVDNNFRKHLIAIGRIQPSADDLKLLARECGASASQMQLALDKFPFK